MGAQEWEVSQSSRLSKRPWEERIMYNRGTAPSSPGQQNLWSGSFLPQLDAIPYTRPQIPKASTMGEGGRYDPEQREAMSKRPRYGASHSDAPAQGHGKVVINAVRSPMYAAVQTTEALGYPPTKSENIRAQDQDPSSLCQRCRRSLRETIIPDFANSGAEQESCDSCNRSPELAYVTQAAAAGLSQLAETLRSGMSSGRRGVAQGPEQRRIGSADCPPIAQFGLKLTLNWLLGKINYVNELADKYVQSVPLDPGSKFGIDLEKKTSPSITQDGAADIMKRRYNSSIEEYGHVDAADSAATADANTPKRRSLTTGLSGPESLPPIRSQPSYYASPNSTDPMAHRSSGMQQQQQQPSAQNRQLPSPPGRSLPSPTALNFQASSTSAYGSSQSLGLPSASNLQQTNVSNVLPPISVAQSSSDNALQAHAAALQHEVSVQKIALSSLQGEHDKLLAAFLRSQTRASALEKKHAVSDSEIISLTEEKLRLQSQVQELEKEIEDLQRSRDEFRQAAVQEGAQYIEIVKKASRLEELASEERKNWNRIKSDMERRIEALKAGRPDEPPSDDVIISGASFGEDPAALAVAESRSESTPVIKFEQPANEPQLSRSKSQRLLTESDSEKTLRAEVRRLQQRCTEIEEALHVVVEEGKSMEGVADTLKTVGKSIMDRVTAALKGNESAAPSGA